jgi:hypothetical protein
MLGLLATLAAGCGGDSGFSANNNDPGEENGVGKAEIYPTAIEFPSCNPGINYSAPFKVTNVGDNTLTVYEVSIVEGGPIFVTEEVAEFGLEPKEDRELVVRVTLPDDQAADGTLRIETSDADALQFDVPLHAEPAPADSGDDSGKD